MPNGADNKIKRTNPFLPYPPPPIYHRLEINDMGLLEFSYFGGGWTRGAGYLAHVDNDVCVLAFEGRDNIILAV